MKKLLQRIAVLTVMSYLAACGHTQTRTVNDCGKPFIITTEEVDALEESGKLDNVARQIKTMLDIYRRCLAEEV